MPPRLAAVPGPASPALDGAPSLDALFRQYSSYVAAIGFRLLGRDDEVNDLVQEVFVEAIRGVAQVREPEAVKGWLATVTVRVAKRRLARRRFWTFFGLHAADDVYEQVATHEADGEQRALLARVYATLDRLPTDQRIAWTLRYVDGQRLDEVAVLCGCSLATAKRRISAAQKYIEEAMGHE